MKVATLYIMLTTPNPPGTSSNSGRFSGDSQYGAWRRTVLARNPPETAAAARAKAKAPDRCWSGALWQLTAEGEA